MSEPKTTPVGKVGNVTKDPELRVTASGKSVAEFGLAVRPYVPRGEPEPETVFYTVTCWGTLAEHVVETLAKGDRVVVVGDGQLEHWTGKDGTEHTTKKITAEGVGPDLRFTGAEIRRAERRAPAQRSSSTDEEPF